MISWTCFSLWFNRHNLFLIIQQSSYAVLLVFLLPFKFAFFQYQYLVRANFWRIYSLSGKDTTADLRMRGRSPDKIDFARHGKDRLKATTRRGS